MMSRYGGALRLIYPVNYYFPSPWNYIFATSGSFPRFMCTISKDTHRPSDTFVPTEIQRLVGSTKERFEARTLEFRRSLRQYCHNMTPRDSFEYRLKSRLEPHSTPCFDNPENVKKGLSYHIYGADWISPKDKNYRTFIEGDSRYRIHWGSFVKGENGKYTGSLMFIPKDPLPHMSTFPNQTKEKQSNKCALSTDPAVFVKAQKLFRDTEASLRSIQIQFRKELGSLCLKISPKDSFTFRLESSSLFKNSFCLNDLKQVKSGLAHRFDVDSFFADDQEFKRFVQDDDRYIVNWVKFVQSNDDRRFNGTVIFKEKDPLLSESHSSANTNSTMSVADTVVPLSSWEEYIRKLPRWQYEVLRDIRLDERVPVRDHTRNTTRDLIVVSDGSFKEGKGTYAWVLGTDEEILLEARGTACGQSMSSNRAEICGILSWLLYLYHYTIFFKISINCLIKPFCDSISASMVVNQEGAVKAKAPEYDLITEARAVLKLLRPRIRIDPISHVKGHQDRKSSIMNLSREAQFNVKADQLARNAMEEWKALAIQVVS